MLDRNRATLATFRSLLPILALVSAQLFVLNPAHSQGSVAELDFFDHCSFDGETGARLGGTYSGEASGTTGGQYRFGDPSLTMSLSIPDIGIVFPGQSSKVVRLLVLDNYTFNTLSINVLNSPEWHLGVGIEGTVTPGDCSLSGTVTFFYSSRIEGVEPIVLSASWNLIRSGDPDADGDGIVDDIDDCPDTPAGTAVDAFGCSNDLDGDGVLNAVDACPDTPAGTQVDATGCPLPPAVDIAWSTNDGAFDESENWNPNQVPTARDNATFGQGGVSRVTVPTLAESKSLIVERGDITLVGGRWNVLGDLLDGVTVGNSSLDAATLNLEGALLTSVLGDIGSGASTDGTVNVPDSDSSWLMSDQLIVGDRGQGDLNLSNGGRVTCDDLVIGSQSTGGGSVKIEGSLSTFENGMTVVGDLGFGSLKIDGASLNSTSAEIGSGQGSIGTAEIKGASGLGIWTINNGNLTVGKSGTGTLEVFGGNRVDINGGDLRIGIEAGSNGTVTISGASTAKQSTPDLNANQIDIGFAGNAAFTMNTRATAQAQDLFIAEEFTEDGSRGDAIVTGSSTLLTLLDSVTVAGALSIQDSAVVACAQGLVGSLNVGSFDGAVDVGSQGSWDITGPLTVGDADDGEGNAVIGLTGGLYVHGGGVVDCDTLYVQRESTLQGDALILANTATINGTVAPGLFVVVKQADAVGTLTIEGDLIMDGGTIEIDVAGLDEGTFSKLVVTGNVTLTDTTIQMNFIDGFQPLTGDQIPFLEVMGTTTITNLRREFTGADDNFEYDLTETNGMLIFQATNDAQGEPTGSGCAASATTNGNPATTLWPVLLTTLLLLFRRRPQLPSSSTTSPSSRTK